jgi:hypothetical protein
MNPKAETTVNRRGFVFLVFYGAFAAVQTVAQLLARFEEGDVLFGNGDRFTRAGIATLPRIALLDRKSTETAKLDTIAARQCVRNFIENSADNTLNIPLEKVRVQFRQT